MTQEQKDLLVKDLCARLPYGVKVQVMPLPNNEYVKHLHFNAKVTKIDIDYIEVLSENGWLLIQDITEIRPYLFPLASMTEQQYEELNDNILGSSVSFDNKNEVIYDMCGYSKVYLSDVQMIIDWLYKNHFDVNNLIENGLAIDCTNLNIY